MMRSVRPAVGGDKALEDGRGRGWAARRMYRGFASVCEPEDIAAGEGLPTRMRHMDGTPFASMARRFNSRFMHVPAP